MFKFRGKMKFWTTNLTLILLSFATESFSQIPYELSKINEFYSIITTHIDAEKVLKIENLRFTSIILKTDEKNDEIIKIVNILSNKENSNYELKFNNDEENETKEFSTELLIFAKEQNSLNIDFGTLKGDVKILLFYATQIDIKQNFKYYKFDNPCEKPPMISYNIWRKGLPDPKPPREKTKVEHLVIHHSAGSNSDTDYINTVRNIYLLHTQSNGWDDIGYNFLIAPNGIIFNGRDPQGAGDDDNILGAHFCSKNQNTMGICLLGNFMTKKPSNESLFSLKYLLAWKLKKEKINAFGKTPHPQPSGDLLDNICGHRNGCSTSCPGDSLYILIENIKTQAAEIADSCGLILGFDEIEPEYLFTVYPNPSVDFINFSYNYFNFGILKIYDSKGNLISENIIKEKVPIDIKLNNGLYFYNFYSGNKLIKSGKIISN